MSTDDHEWRFTDHYVTINGTRTKWTYATPIGRGAQQMAEEMGPRCAVFAGFIFFFVIGVCLADSVAQLGDSVIFWAVLFLLLALLTLPIVISILRAPIETPFLEALKADIERVRKRAQLCCIRKRAQPGATATAPATAPAPAPAPAATGGARGRDLTAAGVPEGHTFLEVLTVLYSQFNPAKLGEVPVFAHKYVTRRACVLDFDSLECCGVAAAAVVVAAAAAAAAAVAAVAATGRGINVPPPTTR
jgi:hypothetical protein